MSEVCELCGQPAQYDAVKDCAPLEPEVRGLFIEARAQFLRMNAHHTISFVSPRLCHGCRAGMLRTLVSHYEQLSKK